MLDMQARMSYDACTMTMKKKSIQYTIRNVPDDVDGALRKLAVREGASINAVALDALKAGAGVTDESVRYHDLDGLAGTWVQDDAFDRAIEVLDETEKDLWR